MVKFFIFSKGAETIRGSILRTSFLNLLARLFGYLKQLSIAILFGFNYHTDAFFMALSIIGIFLIFADVFDSLGIPNLVSARQKDEESFKRLAGLLLTFTSILSLSVLFLAIILFPLFSKIAVGFDEKSLKSLEISYFLLLPYTISYFFFHHFGAILRSVRRFTAYFVGEFIFSLLSFVFIALGLWLYNSPIVLPLSVSFSNVIATIYMVIVGREFLHFKLYYDETVKQLLRQFFYLLALYGVFHLFVVVDRSFSSLLGEKGVSALTYGSMVAFVLRSIFKLEHMAITALSEGKANLEIINKFAKLSIIASLPVMFFLFLFPEIPVSLLFGHGKFQATDVALTAEATRFYSLSLFFSFLWPILYRAFQVLNWLMPVFLIALTAVILNGFFNYLFLVIYKLGIAGICLGTFLAYLSLCGFSYIILIRRVKANVSR